MGLNFDCCCFCDMGTKNEGVETFMTDMPRHRVVVRGRINCEKVVKKLKKKAGKRAEILSIEEVDGGSKNSDKEKGDISASQETPMLCVQREQPWMLDPCWDSEVYRMFSEENPNACSTM